VFRYASHQPVRNALGENMKIIKNIWLLLKGWFMMLFPSTGPKGVIDTQITIYKRLKAKFPAAGENDVLNSLIMSRVNAPMSPTTKSEELSHYESLLQSTNKTLEDVIGAIVEYEYILSRGEELHKQLADIGAPPPDVAEEIEKWFIYIREKVEEVEKLT